MYVCRFIAVCRAPMTSHRAGENRSGAGEPWREFSIPFHTITSSPTAK
jgi:hypothetical protein